MMTHETTYAITGKCRSCDLYSDDERICAQLSLDELIALASTSASANMQRRETPAALLLERHPVLSVISGVIGLQCVLKDGRRALAALYWPGDIIDLRSAGDEAMSLVALTPARVCAFAAAPYERILRDNPQARSVAFANLDEQVRFARAHGVDLAKKSVVERLAAYILECRRRQGSAFAEARDAPPVVDLALRRADIADYMGLQPETVSRGLKALERAGLVALLPQARVQVRDMAALQRLAEGAPLDTVDDGRGNTAL